jgi:hypothetical protein
VLGIQPEAVMSLPFEDGGNTTHMLVKGFDGQIPDVDLDDDGVIDTPAWSEVIDHVSVVAGSDANGDPLDGTLVYGFPGPPVVVGPMGAPPGKLGPQEAPYHVWRAPGWDPVKGWRPRGSVVACWSIGPPDPVGGLDTPGQEQALGGLSTSLGGNTAFSYRGGGAGNLYMILGSAPPFPGLPGDPYLAFLLTSPNSLISPSLGFLDASGSTTASWGPGPLAQGALGGFVGAAFDHVLVELDGSLSPVGWSNFLPFQILP